MICVGVESTAHTFGIGIVNDKGRVLADVRDSYRPPIGWGIEPAKAGQHHKEVKEKVIEEALNKAKIHWDKIDIISFSQGPGLSPCLVVGKDFAAWLAEKYNKPLYPVNHPVGHIEIAKLLTKTKDPVIIYASGGNTQIISYGKGYYRVFGECMDMGIGNALDKFGREAGIGFPAGPKIEELAKNGKYIELPYVVKGMDLSFSGILTAAINLYKKNKNDLGNICFSLQETVFAMLTEVTERATAYTGKKEAVLTGGVAANQRLKEMLDIMCKDRGARFYSCPMEYCADNGVMIAWTGILASKSNRPAKPGEADIKPYQRVDDVKIGWIE